MSKTVLLLCFLIDLVRMALPFSVPLPRPLSKSLGLDVRSRIHAKPNEDSSFHPPPNLAIITEPDACIDDCRMEKTFAAIKAAVATNKVTLVSIRLTRSVASKDDVYYRAQDLAKRLLQLAEDPSVSPTRAFHVVCSSDWIDLGLETNVHGIHVKESHLSKIPFIRESASRPDILIGTSTHGIDSALLSLEKYCPDYYFVGTCFLTKSHPEKALQDLEGPVLPGKVRKALEEKIASTASLDPNTVNCPTIFAIGGIDEHNCNIPVSHGANGVAVIRAILQSDDPANTTRGMFDTMDSAMRATSISGL